mmetsp:Transcript_31028/g.56283  ORF Transcript_31028/g.56283 Transcript_31028/m.56283 type:complete len:88 (+) Transcript_31028:1261-1524(+)
MGALRRAELRGELRGLLRGASRGDATIGEAERRGGAIMGGGGCVTSCRNPSSSSFANGSNASAAIVERLEVISDGYFPKVIEVLQRV